MNRWPIRASASQLVRQGLPLLAAVCLAFGLGNGSAWAGASSGTGGAATPASETEHTNEEDPAEPAGANPTLPPDQESLALRIFNELISPCCWTTTVAQHGSGAAPRIQAEVRRMIASGMTHQEILDRYVEEYGERILASPKKKGFNLAVYWVPPLVLAVGILLIAMASRKKGRERTVAKATAGGDGHAMNASAPAAPPPRPVPASEEDYRRRLEEEIRRSS